MRALALCCCIVALGIVASPAMAGRGADNDAAGGATTTAAANSSPTPATKADPASKPAPSSSEIESELQQMRDLLESQSKQLQEQQQRMELLEEQLNAANAAREDLAVPPASADPAAIGPNAAVAAANASTFDAGQGMKTDAPTAISFKGITLTPGGFMAAETVFRNKALSADINTPFNSDPLPGSSQSQVSEFNASARQSRISMLVEGKLDTVKIGGYYEADFLSAGVTSNSNESNSYTFRQRQFWAQAKFNSGWTFTGGQMWSLVTETKKGLDNRTEAPPLVIDSQYNVGFSWARQYGFRVTKDFGDKLWLGFSVEEPETTLTVHGQQTVAVGGTVVTTPTGTATINPVTDNNFLLGTFGASSGLLNPTGTYAFSAAPDFVVKAAFEPGWGHYEIFGVVSTFRDRIFPNFTNAVNPALGATNDTRAGGGVGANARVTFFKKLDAGLHFIGGDGIGRYGTGGLADVTVRPDGTIAPIRNFQSLGSLELHLPKADVYAYVGGEYNARAAYLKSGATVPNEGYGAIGFNNYGCFVEALPLAAPSTSTNLGVPTGVGGTNGFITGALGNCTGDTRNLIEGTIGFWYRFYKGSRGTVQFGPQYSYLVRNTWSGVGDGTQSGVTITSNGAPHATDSMFWTSFRYILP